MRPVVAELKGVSRSFGQGNTLVRALSDIDLQIHAGEITLIEGPSGSGKTTLLHIVGLLQRADEGEVWIDGRRVDQIPEIGLPRLRRENVSLVFQGYNLLDALTVRDNIAVAGMLNEGSHRATPVDAYLERFHLVDRGDHLPAQLSGGEMQRTAIARALASQGRLLLTDEPTANLDWANAQDVAQCLADIARCEGRAVVIVSHDSRLEPFVDRIVGLLDGRISGDRRVTREETHINRQSRARLSDPMCPTPPPQYCSPAGRRRGIVPALWLCVLVLVVSGCAVAVRYLKDMQVSAHDTPRKVPAESTSPRSGTSYVAAAPAVVEPVTQLVALRAERTGRIKAILKQAGDAITAGEPLVLLEDDTPRAVVAQRESDLMLAEARLAKLFAWDRPELREKAKAGVERAQARRDRATRESARIEGLYDKASASQTELNLATEEKRLAEADVKEAQQALAMSEAGPIEEEVAVARAQVAQARAALNAAKVELSLRTIVAPLEGHVIYRHMEAGEVVSPESPVPILSVGNLDDVRLRAEVDEADIARVAVGQSVIATTDALGDQVISGRVVHLEAMMGRKNIRTERAIELVDTKVREVLVELEPGAPKLPIDLQMTVRFLEQ